MVCPQVISTSPGAVYRTHVNKSWPLDERQGRGRSSGTLLPWKLQLPTSRHVVRLQGASHYGLAATNIGSSGARTWSALTTFAKYACTGLWLSSPFCRKSICTHAPASGPISMEPGITVGHRSGSHRRNMAFGSFLGRTKMVFQKIEGSL